MAAFFARGCKRRVGKGAACAVPTISLTKRTRNILHIPAPIRNEHAWLDVAMKGCHEANRLHG